MFQTPDPSLNIGMVICVYQLMTAIAWTNQVWHGRAAGSVWGNIKQGVRGLEHTCTLKSDA